MSAVNEPEEEIEESWATTEASVNKQNKLFKEDLEQEMPEFYVEDPEKISY